MAAKAKARLEEREKKIIITATYPQTQGLRVQAAQMETEMEGRREVV